MRDKTPAYRPRYPERTALTRLFERHWEDYKRVHEVELFGQAGGRHDTCWRIPMCTSVENPKEPSPIRHPHERRGSDT